MAVLDSQFRVRGVTGLRVVDASSWAKIPGECKDELGLSWKPQLTVYTHRLLHRGATVYSLREGQCLLSW